MLFIKRIQRKPPIEFQAPIRLFFFKRNCVKNPIVEIFFNWCLIHVPNPRPTHVAKTLLESCVRMDLLWWTFLTSFSVSDIYWSPQIILHLEYTRKPFLLFRTKWNWPDLGHCPGQLFLGQPRQKNSCYFYFIHSPLVWNILLNPVQFDSYRNAQCGLCL